MWQYNYANELAHFGIKGMKWGVRRYQNKDGTLTSEGKKRVSDYKTMKQKNKDVATEGKKLFGQDKRLKEDFGSFDQIDDADFFEYVARMYGLNTEQYWSKVVDSRNFYRDNKKSIDTGRKIVSKLGIKV